MHRPVRQHAFTLLEMMIVIAIAGILAAVATPQFNQWLGNQRLKAAARSVADMFMLARSEAIRTGNNHVLFFRVQGVSTSDSAGTSIEDASGDPTPILLIDDGPAATANCLIDPGELRETVLAEPNVRWGTNTATARAPLDTTAAPFAAGITFVNPASPTNAINRVIFRSDGIPVAFSGTPTGCGTVGDTGTGRGAIYLTNDRRDYAIVLSPLGGVRVHGWEPNSAQWTN